MNRKNYEVLWYIGKDEETALQNGEYETKEFWNRKQALKWYEKHKNDEDKWGFWVTKRDIDWYVIEDIIY